MRATGQWWFLRGNRRHISNVQRDFVIPKSASQVALFTRNDVDNAYVTNPKFAKASEHLVARKAATTYVPNLVANFKTIHDVALTIVGCSWVKTGRT